MHDSNYLVTRPGMSQVYGFRRSTGAGGEINQSTFSQNVRDVILESITTTHDLAAAPNGDVTLNLTYAFAHKDLGDTSRGAPNIVHGTDMTVNEDGMDMEANQVLYAPFAWDQLSGYPAKRISRTADASELNENTMLTAGFALRTTREPGNALRPLIDANIRAMWANPRWDSPLGLSNLAAYTPENQAEISEPYLPMQTNSQGQGFAYWGAGRDPSDGSTRVILFDIPREDLVSLGQLQHTGAGRFSYEPTYIVGNSYANPRLPLDDWRTSITDTFSVTHQLRPAFRINGPFNLYDASYLVNQRMWDRHVFTTLPQMNDNVPGTLTPANPDYAGLLARESLLPNPRFLPYQPKGLPFDASTLKDEGNAAGSTGSFHHNAGFLLVDGAFNVNSTSPDAWEAFLSGTLELPVQRVDEDGRISGFTPTDRIRVPRVKASFGEGVETDALDENYWTGFRALRQNEVRDLAEAIVREVKTRGPFLNMAEFVNRSLDNGVLGHAGPLQAALDATVNKDLDSDFERDAPASPGDSTQGAGFPGQLLQGDLLQALSPLMSVRSDTFTIRSFGELKTLGGGQTEAKAWCEMVVQRLPDPVLSTGGSTLLSELANPSSPWGRRFEVISFRWLAEDEI